MLTQRNRRILFLSIGFVAFMALGVVVLLALPAQEEIRSIEGSDRAPATAADSTCTRTWNCAFSNGDNYGILSYCCYTCTFVGDSPAGCSGITSGVKSYCHWQAGNTCRARFTLRD